MIGVKRNQKNLYSYIEHIVNSEQPVSRCHWTELNRGRLEYRETSVFNCQKDLPNGWTGAKQLVKVSRKVKRKGKVSHEVFFYISSLDNGFCRLYAHGIRAHWSIENSLHWVKDVTLHEDRSKIIKGEAPSIISTLRNGALNIFRNNGMNHIQKAIRLTANDIGKLYKLIL